MKKITSLIILALILTPFFSVNAETLIQRVKGKILLQVEENGEAWYIHPIDLKKYYLGRPIDAFNVMRELGLGITNDDLSLIPITPLEESDQLFRANEYQFFIPASWEVNIKQTSPYLAEFVVDGVTQAKFQCPMPEQGFEAWTFDQDTRFYTANGQLYGVDYWAGIPVEGAEDLGRKYLMFMHRNEFDNWYSDGNYQYSCWLEFLTPIPFAAPDLISAMFYGVRQNEQQN